MEQDYIVVKDLNKYFENNKGEKMQVLRDINFTVKKSEIVCIVGSSGCGKSTLAKMLVGSLSVSCGSIKLSGEDYTGLKGKKKQEFRRKIQMVFQDPLSSFSPRMKIGTYLAEPRRNYDHISKKEAMKEAEDLLKKVGLPKEFILRYPHELSGGQLQRVAIARAIAIQPELLICDEATGALDVSIQNQIAKLLVKLVQEQSMGCIFIGHDLALVRSVTQRIAVMYLGKIVEILNSENLEQSCCHPYTRALLNSIFDVYCDQKEEIQLLKGEPPSPLQVHSGCPFAPRCPKCTQECCETMPKLQRLSVTHAVACFHWM